MDERLLVKRAKRGDTAAFAELYGTIYKRLYQFALYTLGNTQDAEDVVSAAVMEAFENIGKLRKEDAFSVWEEKKNGACLPRVPPFARIRSDFHV